MGLCSASRTHGQIKKEANKCELVIEVSKDAERDFFRTTVLGLEGTPDLNPLKLLLRPEHLYFI